MSGLEHFRDHKETSGTSNIPWGIADIAEQELDFVRKNKQFASHFQIEYQPNSNETQQAINREMAELGTAFGGNFSWITLFDSQKKTAEIMVLDFQEGKKEGSSTAEINNDKEQYDSWSSSTYADSAEPTKSAEEIAQCERDKVAEAAQLTHMGSLPDSWDAFDHIRFNMRYGLSETATTEQAMEESGRVVDESQNMPWEQYEAAVELRDKAEFGLPSSATINEVSAVRDKIHDLRYNHCDR